MLFHQSCQEIACPYVVILLSACLQIGAELANDRLMVSLKVSDHLASPGILTEVFRESSLLGEFR